MDKSLICQVPLFSTLPPAEIEALAAELQEVDYPAETVLFREGERGDKFYIVADGQIEIIKAMDTPNARRLAIRGTGEFIGEMSLLNRDGLRTASARVYTDARLLEMTRAEFDALLHREPTIAYEMLRVLSTRLRQAHNVSIRDLKEKNRKLAEAYANLKTAQEQIIEKEIMERELSQAREIQESMLPRTLPKFGGYDIGARMVPARAVGGDLFDVIPLASDKLGIVVGDVSGKGVPAALFMALTTSLMRAEARRDSSPRRVLNQVNRLLLEMNAKGMFVTILYGILQGKTREFVYVRGGHELPLVWDKNGKIVPLEMGSGQPLAILPNPILKHQALTIPLGGTMLLFTDGATEARDAQGNFFDEKGLESQIPSLLDKSAQEVCDQLVRVLMDYQGTSPQADDITLVAVRVST